MDRALSSRLAAEQARVAGALPAPSGPSRVNVVVSSGSVPLATVRGITVHASIAQPLADMLDAASAAGIHLSGSGYRSSQRQVELRRQNCGSSQYAIYQMSSSQCRPPTARPGRSMHERGLAIDFRCGDGGAIRSRSSPCFRWLASNAARYGFYNLPSEPWHWSTTGQ
jgi:LAS superfamily LD-carboxypeptidase LdcB